MSFLFFPIVNDGPIDMLTNKREMNKTSVLQSIFLWSFFIFSIIYFIVVASCRIVYDYEDSKMRHTMQDRFGLKMDEISMERGANKLIPDFLSNWAIVKSVIVLLFSVGLFFIQKSSDSYAVE
jgi:hypothetical protein